MVNLDQDQFLEIECSLLRIRAIGALFCLVGGDPDDSNFDLNNIWHAMGGLLAASAEEALEVLDTDDQTHEYAKNSV